VAAVVVAAVVVAAVDIAFAFKNKSK